MKSKLQIPKKADKSEKLMGQQVRRSLRKK